MGVSSPVEGATAGIRTWCRIVLAVGICCYVLAVGAGMFLLSDDHGFGLLALLWFVAGVLLAVLIRGLGVGGVTALGAALFIVFASVASVSVAGIARDGLTLQHRGERVRVTVVKERLDPPRGRGARHSHYTLERQDGTRVPGPEMETMSDRYDVGDVLTVVEDPEGKLGPQTPGQADATGDVAGAGAFGLVALGAVGWMTWRGSDTAKRRDRQKLLAAKRKAYPNGLPDHMTQNEQQEEKLREALRTFPADRRGYIKVQPGWYPDVSLERAARIAWEMGLRAEAAGNRGSWRFGETVMEEVPHD
ncbi:hypothetical protein [Streptomyces sp. A 4/2]|uniref:hypothetical protein n=1 Tax=Streptomyces sp. A 4/2 TaxID=2934314 RepID=UPI002024F433|nr:hypothetical protein [Streptomyces sp. A 4/2]